MQKEIFKYRFKKAEENNNILLVSEEEQLAYLPYFVSKVNETYQENQDIYKSIQDVIDKNYVVPLAKFQNSSFSRFRESFHLMRNKEYSSVMKALDLGLELMFQYNLNPIIIAACRNLDELDIYLSCLDDKVLEDFDCFEIKFEVLPTS